MKKNQAPSTKLQRNFKSQAAMHGSLHSLKTASSPIEVAVWCFSGAWVLELGASCVCCQLRPLVSEWDSQPAPPSASTFDWIAALLVFMLATFVGLEVVRRVSRLLHTPLMSLTNAISAIAVVGAMMVAGPDHRP